MIEPFLLALGISVALTLLICTIEVSWGSKSDKFRFVFFNTAFLIYALVVVVGNVATTRAAASIGEHLIGTAQTEPTRTVKPSADPPANALIRPGLPTILYAFLYAFAGVFAFKALLEQVNLTFAGKGVLTIEDWISKAREGAVAASIAARADALTRRTVTLSQQLNASTVITDPEMNTYVDTWLGAGRAAILDAQATAAGGNPRLYKSLALASGAYDQASALAR